MYFFKILFYLLIHETHREAETFQEPDVVLDPSTPGSWPEPKADTKLLSHPVSLFSDFYFIYTLIIYPPNVYWSLIIYFSIQPIWIIYLLYNLLFNQILLKQLICLEYRCLLNQLFCLSNAYTEHKAWTSDWDQELHALPTEPVRHPDPTNFY